MDIPNFILLATEQAAERGGFVGVAGTLGLNWKLFIGQVINFSVILLILWKWVFRPVSGALENRRKKIEDSVAKAEIIEKQLQETTAIREQQLRKTAAEAETILKKNTEAAEKAKAELISTAKHESEKILATAKITIETEKQQMLREVKTEITDLVVMATEKIINEKMDEKKDKELIREIITNISK